MKLSDLQEIIDETLKIGLENKEHTLSENPELVFSIGKPTDNKHLQIVGAGIAGNMDNEPVMFLAMEPKNNVIATLYSMMSKVLGEERAKEVLRKVRDELEKNAETEPSTNSKVDA